MKNIEINKSVLYGVIGLLIGIIVATCFSWNHRGGKMHGNKMMHRMPDGTMMENDDHDMSSMMEDMNKALEGKTGDAFDQAFLSEMITHHEGAVAMAQKVLEVSKKPELIKLANDIITAQNKEIEMMKAWQTAWK